MFRVEQYKLGLVGKQELFIFYFRNVIKCLGSREKLG